MKMRPTSSQKPSASTSAHSTPHQASLPGIERASKAPAMPTPNTRPAEALALLVRNGHLDQRDFLQERRGWRLAAAVHVLRRLGWPIKTVSIPLVLANGESAHVARYVLDRQAAGFIAPELVGWLAIVTPAAAGVLALVLRWLQ